MILVVFALRQEAADFQRWLAEHPADIRVELIGVGARSVEEKLPRLLEKYRPTKLIAAGFAGALTNQLKLGSVFCAHNFTNVETDISPKVILHSSSSVVDSPEERTIMATNTGASAVDMESATISQIAASFKIPLLTLRVITDTPDTRIPIPFHVTYDLPAQDIRRTSTLFWLLCHPQNVPQFVQFLKTLRQARRSLTDAIISSVNKE